jgi:hypothetical protein
MGYFSMFLVAGAVIERETKFLETFFMAWCGTDLDFDQTQIVAAAIEI